MKKYIYILLPLILFLYSCSDKPPEVRVVNQSKLYIDVFFKISDCSCPSVSFINISPLSETDYKECSVNKYDIQVKTIDITDETTLSLRTEINKKYQIMVDSVFNCSIDVFDQ
jgi:hypothetical protein